MKVECVNAASRLQDFKAEHSATDEDVARYCTEVRNVAFSKCFNKPEHEIYNKQCYLY